MIELAMRVTTCRSNSNKYMDEEELGEDELVNRAVNEHENR